MLISRAWSNSTLRAKRWAFPVSVLQNYTNWLCQSFSSEQKELLTLQFSEPSHLVRQEHIIKIRRLAQSAITAYMLTELSISCKSNNTRHPLATITYPDLNNKHVKVRPANFHGQRLVKMRVWIQITLSVNGDGATVSPLKPALKSPRFINRNRI